MCSTQVPAPPAPLRTCRTRHLGSAHAKSVDTPSTEGTTASSRLPSTASSSSSPGGKGGWRSRGQRVGEVWIRSRLPRACPARPITPPHPPLASPSSRMIRELPSSPYCHRWSPARSVRGVEAAATRSRNRRLLAPRSCAGSRSRPCSAPRCCCCATRSCSSRGRSSNRRRVSCSAGQGGASVRHQP